MALIDPASLAVAARLLWLPLTALAQAWMLAYPLWIARRRVRLPEFPRPRAVPVEVLVALAALLAVNLTLTVAFLVLGQVSGGTVSPGSPLAPLGRSFNRLEWFAFVILVVAIAPIAEEVFFRGMLYNALRQGLHTVVAAPLQAVAFGLIHPFGLVDSAAVALVGLACALLYEWRKTLLAPVLLHSMVNVLAIAVMAWGIAADAAASRLGVGSEAHEGGCQITTVVPDSAAETAGLRVGDVITSVDGDRVSDPRSLTQVVRSKRVGQKVVVEFMRDGTVLQVDAVLKRLRE